MQSRLLWRLFVIVCYNGRYEFCTSVKVNAFCFVELYRKILKYFKIFLRLIIVTFVWHKAIWWCDLTWSYLIQIKHFKINHFLFNERLYMRNYSFGWIHLYIRKCSCVIFWSKLNSEKRMEKKSKTSAITIKQFHKSDTLYHLLIYWFNMHPFIY